MYYLLYKYIHLPFTNMLFAMKINIIESYRANTYCIKASHSKKLSSLMGPATIPSGGFNVSSVK